MEKQLQLLEKALILGDQQTAMQPSPTKIIQCNHKIKGTEGLVYYIATTQFLIQDFEGKPETDPLAAAVAKCLRYCT